MYFSDKFDLFFLNKKSTERIYFLEQEREKNIYEETQHQFHTHVIFKLLLRLYCT